MISKKNIAGLIATAFLFAATGSYAVATEMPADLSALTEKASAVAGKMININTADVSTLANIPGVGDTVAQAITKYREAHGSFTEIKDLLNIDGIDATLLEKIAPLLKI